MSLKKILMGMLAGGMLLTPLFSGAEAPEGITFAETVSVIPALEGTFDAAENLVIMGTDADGEVLYSSFDESVAVVSEDGLVTAAGYGTTTIVAASALDDTISTSMDIIVFPLYGTFSGTKYIEAMDCDISIDITLYEDGTFAYYRGPMYIAMAGDGESEALEDEGTWEMSGLEITFTSETLGEYTMTFEADDDMGSLTGKLPTGGAATEMELVKEIEEETEAETEMGTEADAGADETTVAAAGENSEQNTGAETAESAGMGTEESSVTEENMGTEA
ncbi:MAG: Ig-like domain-containing protein [Lachnospiraceae bacterium]|nr:Ig-like domain-containing protein [Lachnospiraceae bacterium]